MPSASEPAAPTDPAPEADAFQAPFAALQDRLLLFLRDGAWRPVADLAAWLAPRVPAAFAVQRYLAAGGTADKKLAHKSGEGQKLILRDLLDVLHRKRLLALRRSAAGEEARATPWKDERFEIDPEFENLLPRAPDEVRKLEERLLVEAARDPLVVWKGQRKLVDGHTRYRLLTLLGRPYSVVEMEFPSRRAVIAWLYDVHYGRRSYSAEMKSYVRGRQYLARKQRHGGARARARAQSGPLKTAEVIAAEYGVGRNTVRRDAAFAEALDKIATHCGDEMRQQVLARVAKWTRRDVERLAQLDPPTVQELVQVALTSGKRPRFPLPTKSPARKVVHLPLGKPVEQVRVLRKVLGGKALLRLQRALTRFVEKPKRAASS
jgi:hypothetical protein